MHVAADGFLYCGETNLMRVTAPQLTALECLSSVAALVRESEVSRDGMYPPACAHRYPLPVDALHALGDKKFGRRR